MQTFWKSTAAMVSCCLLVTGCLDTPNAPSLRAISPPSHAAFDASRGAGGLPFTLKWNAEAIVLAGRRAVRAPVANRAYMLLSVAEARALDALVDDDPDNGIASRAGALGGAATTVLTYLFPNDQASSKGCSRT
jgi:hypothetical protein